MAAAKGFCLGWGVPIVPVPTLNALASRFPVDGMILCPVLDARKGEVYAALFRRESGGCVRLSPDMAVAPCELRGKIPDGKVFLCGDGAGTFAALFTEMLGERAVFAPAGEGGPRAGAVGLLAERLIGEGGALDAGKAIPAYLRRPEAELTRGRHSPESGHVPSSIDKCPSSDKLKNHLKSGGADATSAGCENGGSNRKES
jgi:tRNA threonylcarbamoyladenosine biosynthesis protein TsaB